MIVVAGTEILTIKAGDPWLPFSFTAKTMKRDTKFAGEIDLRKKGAFGQHMAEQGWRAFSLPHNQQDLVAVLVPATGIVLAAPTGGVARPKTPTPSNTAPSGQKPPTSGTYTVVFEDGSYATIQVEDGEGKWAGKRFVSYLAGPDNSTDFQGFGFLNGTRLALFKRYQQSTVIQRYVRALEVVIANPDNKEYGEAYAMRSGRCCKCGRKLTVPASLHAGMGPVCAAGGRDA